MFPFFRYDCLWFIFFFFLLFFSRPCFPARMTPEMVTVTTNHTHNDATWRDFSRFLHAERGSQVSGMSELKKYFNHFGYLSKTTPFNFTDEFDSEFESAVTLYQKKLGLSVSGKLDSDTISTIMAPRCGVSDSSSRTLHSTRHFAYFDGKPRWVRDSPMNLTYAFSPDAMITRLSMPEIRTAFENAFSRWASVIPVNFLETSELEAADIRIGFYFGDHGDGEPFDGVLGVLGHAFSPQNGRFHLDAAETWAVDFDQEGSRVAVDLESVATHEIGHVLGLAHTSDKEAVMYPSLSPRTRKRELKMDDVLGIQALYGSNPNFTFSSLLESENSSNFAVRIDGDLAQWPLLLALALFMLFSWT
ncbi:metalloendoproteinase 1-MMP-like [Neltuma alba]|uniref:metalloendoproteinase 1-MMP-like n=1 Tax=Neltuma alba TaxID=207710 RepID=UPI0010A40552|nr:metalloendoproteinase 1-MMP-like [Prosopis alba]XP_028772515.1 metalloendoproteinase 1-MMP-like [Prosopis alba]